VLQLQAGGKIRPMLLNLPANLPENPLHRDLITPAIERFRILDDALGNSGAGGVEVNMTVLHALGNRFIFKQSPLKGKCRVGVVFFEDTLIDDAARSRAAGFDILLAGSTWNEQVLIHNGFKDVRKIIQGIDPAIFHPAPGTGLFKNRYVIFSGGKLEYRKGQDIVVAAFKRFHAKHPEALLLVAWHNGWPETMAEIGVGGYVSGPPVTDRYNRPDIAAWLVENGVLPEDFSVIPETPNVYMGAVVREADVGLFPNRAEGGTNLVAMECMASGVPVILSANTGHLDFCKMPLCFPLKEQKPVRPTPVMRGTEGWGETSVSEIVENLEKIYTDRDAAAKRAARAAEILQGYTWENQVTKLVSAFKDVI